MEPRRTHISLITMPQKNILDNIGLSQIISIINTVLSTNGSMIVPKFVTALYFLAKKPSSASDNPIKETITIKDIGFIDVYST
tara:strand:+ start:334 stop:582 length:249 start_codon:yes stop_codon:yes gene_type:complete